MADRIPLALMHDALGEIGSRSVRLGTDPTTARTQVLNELSAAWAEYAGRDNARRAHDALMMMDAGDLLTRDQRGAYELGQRIMDAPHLVAAARHRAERDAIERRCMGVSEADQSRRAVREIAIVAALMAVAFAVAIVGLLLVVQRAGNETLCGSGPTRPHANGNAKPGKLPGFASEFLYRRAS